MQPAFRFSIKTMGCKANLYDSLLLERELLELGGHRAEGAAAPDLFVLNSCTVTGGADRQSLYEIRQLRKRAPGAFVVLTGCLAQVDGGVAARERGALIDCVVPNDGKHRLKAAVADRFGLDAGAAAPDPEIYWGQLPLERGRTRAFLKVQEGCDDRCTYCIIPYARGASRSVPLADVIGEASRLSALGIHELVLTGTNVADYGRAEGLCFEDLIEALLARTPIARIRLTSLDPSELTDRLLGLLEPGGRVMPHLHVSLQSPVSRVLRAMRRGYRTEHVVSALERIHARGSEIFVGMDVIAGFPSETEAEHAEAVRLLERLPWTRLHVFPYSEREGTPALKLPGRVGGPERKRRAAELMALSLSRHERFARRFEGRTLDGILFESCHEAGGDWFAVGHAPNYLRVMARAPSRTRDEAEAMHQRLGRARIVSASAWPAQDWTLEGVLGTIDA